MARKKAAEVAEDGPWVPAKPKRPYTPSDVLSMKLSKRVTEIVGALAKHYGKKRADVLEALAEATYGQQIEALRNIQGEYEAQSTSVLSGLFDTQPTPAPFDHGTYQATGELPDE